MKKYQVQIAVLGNHQGRSAEVWSNRGCVTAKLVSSALRRAYNANFGGLFDRHKQEGSVLISRVIDRPILRLVEVGSQDGELVAAHR